MDIRKILLPVSIGLVLIFTLYWGMQAVLAQTFSSEPIEEVEAEGFSSELVDPGNGLGPSIYTPEEYIPPLYDPFTNKYRDFDGEISDRIELPVPTDIPAKADFKIYNGTGLASRESGTTNTVFSFNASGTRDAETLNTKLKVRWDFDGDGEVDTYFTRSKSATHQYDSPGIYNVTLEVLDGGGNISKKTRQVKVVRNTVPIAYFSYKPEIGTPAEIFYFDVSKSSDSQYSKLNYRFDWDGDGKWDTNYKSKTTWRHRFDESGYYTVVMEARDQEGLTATYEQYVDVIANSAPIADFTIEERDGRFYFDASGSYDEESPSLKYRWDFNYTGEDDINYNVNWTSFKKQNGNYEIPGSKTIKLQVRDKDGAVSEMTKTVYVND